jgi:HK97 family phage portal protein
MTLFKSRDTHARAYGGYFTSPQQLIPTRPPFATGGAPVTPTTALQKVALLAGTNLVADLPGILDAHVHTGQGGQRREMDIPANVRDPEGNGYGLADFSYKYLHSLVLRGNVFIRSDKIDSNGRPSVCTLLSPDDVIAYRDKSGNIKFRVGSGPDLLPFRRDPQGGIIHRRANAIPGNLLGLSVIANHARTLGLSIASEQFGTDFFSDGAHPTGILTTDQPVKDTDAKTIKDRFMGAIRGSREPAVLGAGVKYTPIQIAPDESQFLETQRWTAGEVCRMIGPGVAEMLGYETGGRMQYQNVQQRSLHLLIYTADKWLKGLERSLSELWLANKQEFAFDRSDLMRMAPTDRWTVYDRQLQNATRTINEVREEEGWERVPWGDAPYLPTIGSTGTAAAQFEQIDAMDGDMDGKLGTIIVKPKDPIKIGGVKPS